MKSLHNEYQLCVHGVNADHNFSQVTAIVTELPTLIPSCCHGEWAHLSGYNLWAPLTKNISSSPEYSWIGKGAKGSQQQPPVWNVAPCSPWCQLPTSIGLAVLTEHLASGQVWQVRALKGSGRRFLRVTLVYTLTLLVLQKGL